MTPRLAILTLAFVVSGASAEAATVIVKAAGIGGSKGMIYVGVCAESFDEKNCVYKGRAPARPGSVEIRIDGVQPGAYAIAVFHDVNGNGELDKIAFLPTEPFGFSNGTGRVGAPNFKAAIVRVANPATSVSIALK